MRYHYEKPDLYSTSYKEAYYCNHPIYSSCTLYKVGDKGLAVIQQRYDETTKHTWWSKIDPWLIEEIRSNKNFDFFFKRHAKEPIDGLYPTVSVRQIMWGLKMKPIKREIWETVFDRYDF